MEHLQRRTLMFQYENNKYEYRLEKLYNIKESCRKKYNTLINKNKKIITKQADDLTCAICLDDIGDGIKTKCGHSFHFHCINIYIDRLIKRSETELNIRCPICRTHI